MTASIKLRRTVAHLKTGGVIAYPTEAVWGLGCDPFDSEAVFHLLALKRRPVRKGVILVAARLEQIEFLIKPLSPQDRNRLTASWPGPVTWLLPHHNLVPKWIYGEHDTVAVRVSAHKPVQDLCLAFGGPLVSTSANPQARPPARSELKARHYFCGSDVEYVSGKIGNRNKPSEIRDLRSGRIYRAG